MQLSKTTAQFFSPPPGSHTRDTGNFSQKIVIAVNLVPFMDEKQLQRQAVASAELSALATPGSIPLNICYPDEILSPAGWKIAPELQRSADLELKIDGKRKPFVTDLFDIAANWATEYGIGWFLLANSDIIITDGLIHEIHRLHSEGFETAAISRNEIEEVDATGRIIPGELIINGYDVFACKTSWWLANRHRFQPYIYGERAWDAVFAAIMACHSRFTMLYVNGLCFHHKHPPSWLTGLYSEYNLKLYLENDKPYSDRYRAFIKNLSSLERSLLTREKITELLAQYFTNTETVQNEDKTMGTDIKSQSYLPDDKICLRIDCSATKGTLFMEPLPTQHSAPKKYTSMSVDAETRFESELRAIFREKRPATIIETGTYLGQGTSSIIWRALRDFGISADFTTIEVNPEHHRRAVEHFKSQGMEIRAELGVSVQREMLPDKTEIADRFITNREYDGIYYDHDESVRADRYFAETNFNVNDDLLRKTMQRCAFKPDFVLLDSAGHMGFIEFQYFMTLIQGDCILMLDDVYHCKHFKTLQVIKQDPRFEILVESHEKFGFCIARYTHIRSLLFIRTDLIGDNILAAAMLPHLRTKYPDAAITVVCQDHVAELYAAFPLVERIISFNLDTIYQNKTYQASILEQIRNVRAELCLNSVFSRTPLSDLLAVASNAKISVAQEGDLFNIAAETRARNNSYYTRLLPTTGTKRAEIQRHHDFLAGIGITTGDLELPFWVLPEDVQEVDKLFRDSDLKPEKTIAFFAGAQDGIKRYESYGTALADICQEQGFTVIALGAKKDHAINQLNLDATRVRTLNLCGATTLRQTGVIISRCRLAVGADTGLAHIACAVGTPNVILLGGWHWGRFLPYSPLTSIVSLPLDCYGCDGKCRYEQAYCITGIIPETITDAIRRTLSKKSDKPRLFAQSSARWHPQVNKPLWVPAESILHGQL